VRSAGAGLARTEGLFRAPRVPGAAHSPVPSHLEGSSQRRSLARVQRPGGCAAWLPGQLAGGHDCHAMLRELLSLKRR
jgi:hypothetical protein